VAELLFLPAVIATLAPSLLGKRSRNTPLLAVLFAFWVADATFLVGIAREDFALASTALRAALNLTLVLITVIGGRIVPAFTANTLRSRGQEPGIRSRRPLEIAAIAGTVAYGVSDVIAPQHAVTAGIAAFAAIAHLLRLAGWQGHRTVRMPILWVLHVAYLWLPLGLAMKAFYAGFNISWAAHWLHALGAGAAGMMILAVMTRAALGHTGRPLEVRPVIALAYALLATAVLLRVFGPALLPAGYVTTLMLAGGAWLAAFMLYLGVYSPILTRPRADGRPG